VVTEQSVKSAARHASEYFRKTNTNAPAAASRYSSGSRESRGITEGKKKDYFDYEGQNRCGGRSARRLEKYCRLKSPKFHETSAGVIRSKLVPSFFLSPFVSPSPSPADLDEVSAILRERVSEALAFLSAFGIFVRLIRSRGDRRNSCRFVQTEGSKPRLLFVSSLPSTFMMIIRKAGGCSIKRSRLVHRVSFEFTSRDALMTAIFISRSFSTRSISWNPEPGRIHFSLAGFAADSRNRNAETCEQRVTNTNCGVSLPYSRSSE